MPGNINKAYQWVIDTCNSPTVGYPSDYHDRNGKTINGITYYDCSSLMYYGLIAGGFDLDPNAWPFVTWTMDAALTALGFTEFDPRSTVLLPGDILVDDWRETKLQHTEMVYKGPEDGSTVNYGWFMGAHGPAPYYSLPDQVSIDSGYAHAYGGEGWFWFNKGFRYGEGGATGYGVSIYVVSAICGNWYVESTINPSAYEGWVPYDIYNPYVYGGYGLGQWTNTVEGGQVKTHRRTDMLAWMQANGYEKNDPIGQLTYLMESKEWIPKAPYSTEFPDFDSFIFSQSTDIDLLTDVFFNCWEGGGTSSGPIRQGHAHEIYEYLRANGNAQGLTWYMQESANTVPQILNNAVLVYQFLSAGGGGGGRPPYYHYSKMPIWMMINYHLI